MPSERQLRQLSQKVLASSPAPQTEVTLFTTDTALTRFSRNAIHQNGVVQGVDIAVRAAVGKRVGVAYANSTESDILERTARRAFDIAQLQPENPDFRSLPEPKPVPQVAAAPAARSTPAVRARTVGQVCRMARDQGVEAYGACVETRGHLVIANSLGLFAHHEMAMAELSVVAMTETSAGYACSLAPAPGDIDAGAVAREACGRALRGRDPVALEPGEYPVVLEPYAVSDILDFLGYLGFSGLAVQEKRSFMAGHIGERVLGPNITIWDDGLGQGTIPVPFDFEGVPKQRVDLVVDGIARGACYDTYTAGRDGSTSTGHALPPGETFGPLPGNMFLKPGNASLEEMIAGLDRGLLVTRFWYTRVTQPLQVEVTGMTRDGTFLVEKGQIVRPVKNLRFTQSYLDALRSVDAISRETRLTRTMFAYNLVPALRISNFRFTGATEF